MYTSRIRCSQTSISFVEWRPALLAFHGHPRRTGRPCDPVTRYLLYSPELPTAQKYLMETMCGGVAASYAEAGQYPKAVEVAHRALDIATQQSNSQLADGVNAMLALYRVNKPFREKQ